MIVKISRMNITEDLAGAGEALMIRGESLKETSVFLDLEHYIFHKPIAIGIFGAAVREGDELVLTQYFLENRQDLKKLVRAARDYLREKLALGYPNLVTFAGKNDLMMLHAMFRNFSINDDLHELFEHVDLQSVFKREFSQIIGLTRLEEFAGIQRENPDISGSTIAKTFGRIMNDPKYFSRMPEEKIQRFLDYNAQDVVNLYHITARWDRISRTEVDKYREAMKEKRIIKEQARLAEHSDKKARLKQQPADFSDDPA